MSDEITRMIDTFFNGRPAPQAVRQAKTTDAPNIKMLMLQIINRFHGDIATIGEMKWYKPFRHKETGKTYAVEIILREVKESQ